VNAANLGLLGGGGVDGMIHARGGPTILAECRDLRRTRFTKGLPTGQAVATTGGNLRARFVIHTVGPIYRSGVDNAQLLRDCYTNSLAEADHLELSTVAFPLISSGAFAWPVDDAIRQALTALRSAQTAVTEVRLVLYDNQTFRMAQGIRQDPTPG
jgi:O-acetyl-ADP-ribose deacetylase (regulator of RNase III)